MNREANTGLNYNAQKDMIPLIGEAESKGLFDSIIADAAQTDKESVISSDLFVYNRQAGTIWGADNEFISAPRLDDVMCAYSCMNALIDSDESNQESVVVCAVFDNEEVGSSTKQGADSTFLSDVLMRIAACAGKDNEDYIRACAGSFMLSADNAHAVHPNYQEKADPTNRPHMNKGIALMGIHTKEFGENTELSDTLLAEPYHQLLNKLAVEPEGILVSDSFRTELGMKEGDTLYFKNGDEKEAKGKIVGFVSYWPGFQTKTIELNEAGELREKDNYLIVADYAALRQYFGVTPYQVWITVKEGESTDFFYQWMEENEVSVKSYTDRDRDLANVSIDPLLQGTNGVLTMSFIVTMILCAAGYLIYWIMSIRSRELMFGILRACGMHKEEIFHMLIVEQIFSGAVSVFAGFGIGKIASVMFTSIFQAAYAGADQVLPVKMVTNSGDLAQLYGVTATVMIICLGVLTILVLKMNIAKALKLGEE